MRGLTARQTGHRGQRLDNNLYEYQWKLEPRAAARMRAVTRTICHRQDVLASRDAGGRRVLAAGGSIVLGSRTNSNSSRGRPLSAYIVRALRELGLTPELRGVVPNEQLAERLGIAPQYHRWLSLMLKELTARDIATEDPHRLWKAAWDEFPECQAELKLLRSCGENLPAVLRDDFDPLNLIFPEGDVTAAEALYQDSPTFRLNNLLVQKAVVETVRRLPKGKAPANSGNRRRNRRDDRLCPSRPAGTLHRIRIHRYLAALHGARSA